MVTPIPSTGRIEAVRHLYPVRVYFEDTDLSGVVYHANYLRWFERARSDLLRLLGIDQRRAHDAGEGVYAVTDAALRYLRPARMEDVVIVESRVEDIAAASCAVSHRALRGDELLCEAQVRFAFVAPSGRPRRHPGKWVDAFRAFADGTFHTYSIATPEQQGSVPA